MSSFSASILLATDGSENSARARGVAVELSEATSSELHVVYVGEDAYSSTLTYPEAIDPGGIVREDPLLLEQLEGQFEQMSRRVLETEAQKVREVGGTVAQAHLRMGKAAAEIVDLAEELSVGLLVMGSRGLGGIKRALMGSVSDAVVSHAHCPVLVVRGGESGRARFLSTKILLATDGSEDAALAARVAAELAQETGSELHLVHVRPKVTPHQPGYYVGPGVIERAPQKEWERLERESQRLLDAQVEGVRSVGCEVARTYLRVGRPDEEITAQAEEIGAGLIVMGSRGLGGIKRALIGSVSDSVVRYAHCPVLVVRKDKW